MTCRDLCRKFKAPTHGPKGSPTNEGLLFCSGCGDANSSGLYLEPSLIKQFAPAWNGKTCPCCHRTLQFRYAVMPRAR